MALLDKVKKVAAQHGDKIDKGIDKAAAVAEKRTKGKQRSRVQEVAEKAKGAVDKLADDDQKKRPDDEPPSRTTP